MKLVNNVVLAAAIASASASASASQLPHFSRSSSPKSDSSCHCLPSDSCWPSVSTWQSLNATVGGRLIATIPLGRPCHDPYYNETECAYLQSQWHLEPIHFNSSSSVMAPFFANQSCDPWQLAERPCLLGNYVDYAVNVSSADDIVAAINFAQDNNVRFIVRNTGHDYLGKSTGAGALAVWTHHLKDIEFLNWADSCYTGKAMKIGAGVQGYEAISASAAEGYVALTGECPTVGLAGGYTQGGGHSALSTSFGLAADNTLEFEVVTAGGHQVTASPFENEDLYWALSGGGGATYGVVVSMTVKVFPDVVVGGASVFFESSATTLDIFYSAIDTFHALLPDMVDAGCMVVYYFTDAFFEIAPLTAYGQTAAEVTEILSAFISALKVLNINATVSYTESVTYQEHYNTYFGPLPFGNIEIGIAQYGSRMITRDNIKTNAVAVSAAYRNITQNGGVTFIGVGLNVSSSSIPDNSVLPAWRDALVHATLTIPWNFTAPWEEMIELQNQMTYSVVPQMEAATPNSGAYMNEANFRQPNYQEDFFGANYDRLLSIKNKWDPDHLFYAVTAVGSDAWTVDEDGRMCRTCST